MQVPHSIAALAVTCTAQNATSAWKGSPLQVGYSRLAGAASAAGDRITSILPPGAIRELPMCSSPAVPTLARPFFTRTVPPCKPSASTPLRPRAEGRGPMLEDDQIPHLRLLRLEDHELVDAGGLVDLSGVVLRQVHWVARLVLDGLHPATGHLHHEDGVAGFGVAPVAVGKRVAALRPIPFGRGGHGREVDATAVVPFVARPLPEPGHVKTF
eukprot:UN4693